MADVNQIAALKIKSNILPCFDVFFYSEINSYRKSHCVFFYCEKCASERCATLQCVFLFIADNFFLTSNQDLNGAGYKVFKDGDWDLVYLVFITIWYKWKWTSKIIITIKRIESPTSRKSPWHWQSSSSVTMLHGPSTVGANQTEQVTTLTPDTNCQMVALAWSWRLWWLWRRLQSYR